MRFLCWSKKAFFSCSSQQPIDFWLTIKRQRKFSKFKFTLRLHFKKKKKIISGGRRYISRFPVQPAPFNHSYKTGNENVHKIKEKRRKTNHPYSVMLLSHVAHLCLKSYKITCKNADNKRYMVSIFVNAPLRLQSIRISVSRYPIWYPARGGSLGWIVAPLCTFNMQIAWPVIV